MMNGRALEDWVLFATVQSLKSEFISHNACQ